MDFMVIDKTRGRTKREHQRIDIHVAFRELPPFYFLSDLLLSIPL
jgi:hypothetical protein